MPEDPEKIRAALYASALETFKTEYDDLVTDWRELDKKAQANTAICGIFVAGILAFIRQLSPTPGDTIHWLTTICVVLIGASLMFALWGMWLRTITPAPNGCELTDTLEELEQSEELTQQHLDFFAWQQVLMFRQTNTDIRKVNETKAWYIWWSHRFLCFTIFGSVFVVIYDVWN